MKSIDMKKDKNLSLIKNIIAKYHADKIILFGSRAKNTENKFSDYDILAIFNKMIDRKEKFLIANKIRKELAKQFIDVDILIKTKEEVEKSKYEIGNTIKNAISEGWII